MDLRRWFTLFVPLLMLSLLASVLRPTPPESLSPEVLLAAIEEVRASRVIDELLADDGHYWHQFLQGVESGELAWLGAAAQLRPMLSVVHGQALERAVARALPRAPASVLALSRQGFSVRQLCTPVGEGSSQNGGDRKWLDAAEKALSEMARDSSPDESAHTACLARIRMLSKAALSHSGP
ncbi:MAG: hypothetical protein SVU69_09110 [Pseudomonadota bacterium]|nr:hypothetical protein [Pseudomonadota bacterium]